MRDVSGDAYTRIQRVSEQCTSYLSGRGYKPLDTPVLEETELFVRKSGGELTSKLYNFVDPGGNRVSLRPEFTSSVIRHFIELDKPLDLPVRWYYNGPVFRYEPGGNGGYRQFTQVGAELIGSAGLETDIEVLNLALETLRQSELEDFRLRVGHLGVLGQLLSSYGVSEAARLFIIRSVPEIKSGATDVEGLMEQAADVGLLRDGVEYTNGRESVSPDSSDFIQEVLTQAMSSPTGRRTPEDIVGRLLRKSKVVDQPSAVRASLEVVSKLAMVEGPPSGALDQVVEIVAAEGLDVSPIEECARLVDALEGDRSQVVVDFGLARDISYYTGVIFEFVATTESGSISVGGGGRYDGLVKALGGDDVPALGFAIGVEPVVDALQGDEGGGRRA